MRNESSSQRAAFFDLDNTLINGSSMYYLFRGLVTKGVLGKKNLIRFGLHNARFIKSKEENLDVMAKVTEIALGIIGGLHVRTLTSHCEEIVSEFWSHKQNHGITKRVQEHSEIGDKTWLVTAAPIEIADAVARQLGMSGAIGTRSEVEAGLYKGKLIGQPLHGVEKAKAIKELATLHGYDLKKSFAYSDSINDLPMLMTVGKPYAVNPERELQRIALKNNWPILDTKIPA